MSLWHTWLATKSLTVGPNLRNANYRPVIPTGTTIPVGAPTGAAPALAILLGDHRPINRCSDQ